jgi:hypothetical protein
MKSPARIPIGNRTKFALPTRVSGALSIEAAHGTAHSRCVPGGGFRFAYYGVGMVPWAWFEKALSPPATALTT